MALFIINVLQIFPPIDSYQAILKYVHYCVFDDDENGLL
jgi:hypothetical protein